MDVSFYLTLLAKRWKGWPYLSHSLPGVYKPNKLFNCEKGQCLSSGGSNRGPFEHEPLIEGGVEIFGGLRGVLGACPSLVGVQPVLKG